MAAPVPPRAPRATNAPPPPPPNYNHNYQRTPDLLAENMQNLQINQPPYVPNSTPRPPPSYIQSPSSRPSTPYSAPQHSAPFPGAVPISRPEPSPGPQSGFPVRPGMAPTGPPQSTFPPNMAPGRPSGYPISQAPPFRSRPPTGSFPSAMGGQITTSSKAPPNPFGSLTPHSQGSVDYPSIRGIQVDVGLPDATLENRAESPLRGELYPNTSPT